MAQDFYTEVLAYGAKQLLEQRLTIVVPVATPAAGAEWGIKVPGGVRWELISVHSTFIASAAVATRAFRLQVIDSDQNSIFELPANTTATAGQSSTGTFHSGMPATVGNLLYMAPLPTPPITVPNAWTIRSQTTAIDAVDQYSNVTIRVRQWSESDVVQAADMIRKEMQSYLAPHISSQPRS